MRLYASLALAMLTGAAYGNPNCTEFGINIPIACCCSNDCCREARPTEFQHLGGDLYRSVETGQVVKRTGWSSGGTIKCACDWDHDTNQWIKHPRAHVRCLFVPFPSS
jgi:hypothetical protein